MYGSQHDDVISADCKVIVQYLLKHLVGRRTFPLRRLQSRRNRRQLALLSKEGSAVARKMLLPAYKLSERFTQRGDDITHGFSAD